MAGAVLVANEWRPRQFQDARALPQIMPREDREFVPRDVLGRGIKGRQGANNLEMAGRPVRLAGTEAGGAVVVPPLKVRDFNFTSLSDAV